jgi:hypothetical protein
MSKFKKVSGVVDCHRKEIIPNEALTDAVFGLEKLNLASAPKAVAFAV